jgi:hypothetical protein
MSDESPQTQPGSQSRTLAAEGSGWRRRYTSARAAVALILLACLVVPGVAAVIAAGVSAF